ncbi:MAG: ribonuclease HII, partial [Desulfatiglandales bacterium]
MARVPKGFMVAQGLSFFEEMFKRKGYERIAGIDEAGRGCLAGPVVAAAVILRDDNPISGVNDSKELSPKQRDRLFERIINEAVSVSVGVVGALEIDRKNILNATIQAMVLAVKGLSPAP